ncbi:outer membrane protein assembly factor BamD [Denitrificimonas caeni]|uniref:Outer membrane protein assembly factor BamD n=1 Tax=Denitrificimonas caeni TaxID=521720 RepID=A0AAE9VP07_9GAMM|nr:outer membrane protein assembly factor BamD [Denitrificimonas caeni]WBE25267.1 outer membrane protein assembly factor BamD [Denitrificimonas caeni]
MHLRHLLFIAIFTLLGACASKGIDETLSETALYQQAQTDLEKNRYSSAVSKLKALESRYPFGRYAEQAQLELIYAYYKNMEPEASRASADRFIRLHPQHANVDYAYYMKGIASFDQDRGLLARFLPLDMSQRDPGAARNSYNEFAQLTNRFPNSRYAPDAKQRMIYLRNLLAAYEVHVAYFYLKRQSYVAALNRGRYIVENFQETPSVADGLAIMTEAYQHLALNDLAEISLETLQLNYPEHASLASGTFKPRVKDYDERSWLSMATLGFIEGNEDLRPQQTQASKDVIRQYEDAAEQVPDSVRTAINNDKPKRSWLNRLTFGVFGK